MHTPSEIRKLDLAMDAHKDILGLDITMDDMLFMQVYESGRHLGNILRGGLVQWGITR